MAPPGAGCAPPQEAMHRGRDPQIRLVVRDKSPNVIPWLRGRQMRDVREPSIVWAYRTNRSFSRTEPYPPIRPTCHLAHGTRRHPCHSVHEGQIHAFPCSLSRKHQEPSVCPDPDIVTVIIDKSPYCTCKERFRLTAMREYSDGHRRWLDYDEPPFKRPYPEASPPILHDAADPHILRKLPLSEVESAELKSPGVQKDECVDGSIHAEEISSSSAEPLEVQLFAERTVSLAAVVELIPVSVVSVETPRFHDPQIPVLVLEQSHRKCCIE